MDLFGLKNEMNCFYLLFSNDNKSHSLINRLIFLKARNCYSIWGVKLKKKQRNVWNRAVVFGLTSS
jgi:hypothetical protein